jgi:hypothetical protein
MIMRRRRPSSTPRAPSAPAELRRRRLESLPAGEDFFQWRPLVELVVGPPPKLGSGLVARLTALYGRSRTDGDDQ